MNPSGDGSVSSDGWSPMDSIGVRKSDRRTAFPKNLRLLKRAEFRKVYEQGERRSGQLAAIFWCPNGLDRCRLGITVPARVGNAVVRNRIKRRVREVFRREGSSIPAGWDVVLNPRESAAQVPFSTLRRELLRLFPSRPAEKPQAAGAPPLDEREAR